MVILEGYKQTEVGVIPDEWDVKEWCDVASGFSSGATPYRAISRYYSGNIKWVSSGELNYNIIYDTLEHISTEAKRKTNLTMHPAGTFLMAITGLEAAGTRGSCAILGSDATTNQSCMAIYETNKLHIWYLFHYYVSHGDELAFKFCQGTKQQSYTAKIVKKLPIVVPLLTEQRTIAATLSDADVYIAALEKLVAKKRAVKQGAMQELLTGKRRLTGFDDEWVEKKLGRTGDIVTGATPATSVIEYWNGNILWVTPTDISDKKNILNVERKISETGLSKIRELPPNTLLVTCIASIGKNAILRTRGASNQQINAIIPYNDYDVDFLYYLVEINKLVLEGKAGITATKIVSKAEFSKIEIPLPPTKDEQTAIAAVLSDMDAEIDALTAKLEKAQYIKQGMMSELLTGRIRLIEEDTNNGEN